MKIQSSPGKQDRLDTGPPPANVKPARQQPGGPDRQQSIATANSLLPRFGRKLRSLVAIKNALPRSAWSYIRKACLKREVRHYG
jgi:hypothetical protein